MFFVCVDLLFVYCYFFFFFQAEDGIRDVAVTGVQTCALPILIPFLARLAGRPVRWIEERQEHIRCSCLSSDRKSTRLNSSHGYISYAVFCLKKKKQPTCLITTHRTKTNTHKRH